MDWPEQNINTHPNHIYDVFFLLRSLGDFDLNVIVGQIYFLSQRLAVLIRHIKVNEILRDNWHCHYFLDYAQEGQLFLMWSFAY